MYLALLLQQCPQQLQRAAAASSVDGFSALVLRAGCGSSTVLHMSGSNSDVKSVPHCLCRTCFALGLLQLIRRTVLG